MTRTKNIITEIEITNNINLLTYSKLICNTTHPPDLRRVVYR